MAGEAVPTMPKVEPGLSCTWKVLAATPPIVPGAAAGAVRRVSPAHEFSVTAEPHGQEKVVVLDSVIIAGPVTVAVKEPGSMSSVGPGAGGAGGITAGAPSPSCITTAQRSI